MKVTLNNKARSITVLNVVHAAIILFFVFYTTRDLNYNSAFVDEAIYATIGEEVMRGVFWEKAISWMGGSYLYPIMSAYINRIYGLTGVRLMSTVLVLTAGFVAGRIGRQLAGYKAEVLTLFLFFTASISLDLAQIGTYDTPAVAFLALSAYSALHTRYRDTSKNWVLVVLSSIFFTLAVFAKYIAALFAPIVLLIIFTAPKKLKFTRAILWSILFIVPFGLFSYWNLDDLKSLYITSPFTEIKPRSYILGKILNDLSLHSILVTLGIIYAALAIKKEKRKLLLTIFLAGMTPLLFHLGTANARSLWKHLVFTLTFWTPISSFILLKINNSVIQKTKGNAFLLNSLQLIRTVLVVAIITSVWVNFSKHWRFQRSWPSATNSIEFLRERRVTGDIVFAEASTVYKYHLYDGFEDPNAWPSTWYYSKDGKVGIEAMKESIRNKEFNYIILNDFFTPDVNRQLLPDIEANYTLVMTDTSKISGIFDQTTRVWTPK